MIGLSGQENAKNVKKQVSGEETLRYFLYDISGEGKRRIWVREHIPVIHPAPNAIEGLQSSTVKTVLRPKKTRRSWAGQAQGYITTVHIAG